ncbi:MAG TPA: hypothetical protein VJ461_01030 [Candidatus Nanoarchaeia archaeon]|nr:hypothetical protein [Candidatus Nanoarchaeia archaeon]
MAKKPRVRAHIILEAFCMRTVSMKKPKYLEEVVDASRLKTNKVPNPHHDPKYRTPKKPYYCPDTPHYICLDKSCPHLTYINAEKKNYNLLNKSYKKKR